MKLKSFKKNKRLKNSLLALGAIAILGGGIVVLYKKDNLYQDNSSKVEKISQTNEIAYTINGRKLKNAFPVKESGLKVSNVECKDGVTAEWNNELWGLVNINSNNNTDIRCNVNFNFEGTLVNYVKMLSNYSDEIVEDDFGNLRYIGANPNNYVQFNGELWRIIGVMKDIENSNGTVSDKVKLIRNESIGQYLWDNKASGVGSSTSVSGSNDWSDSALQNVLNGGAYYNRTIGSCPGEQNGVTKSCDFSETGLTSDAKSMISESVWNLGGMTGTNFDSLKVKDYYGLERGDEVYTGRPTKWIGKVGLIYPSDFGYATSGGATIDRNTCLTLPSSWERKDDCFSNNWLVYYELIGNNIIYPRPQWTITPYSSNSIDLFDITDFGIRYSYATSNNHRVRPTIYLNSNIGLENGNDGSSNSPFILK